MHAGPQPQPHRLRSGAEVGASRPSLAPEAFLSSVRPRAQRWPCAATKPPEHGPAEGQAPASRPQGRRALGSLCDDTARPFRCQHTWWGDPQKGPHCGCICPSRWPPHRPTGSQGCCRGRGSCCFRKDTCDCKRPRDAGGLPQAERGPHPTGGRGTASRVTGAPAHHS